MPSRRSSDPITQLRAAIDCLPVQTRRAMLEGVRRQPVVVGAYTDGNGGACPMLAAHRAGSRVSFLPFARAWDAFARARECNRGRLATKREVKILVNQLEASLLMETDVADLGGAIAEHHDLVAKTAVEQDRERRALEAIQAAAAESAQRRVARAAESDRDAEKAGSRRRKLPRFVREDRLFTLADELLAYSQQTRSGHDAGGMRGVPGGEEIRVSRLTPARPRRAGTTDKRRRQKA